MVGPQARENKSLLRLACLACGVVVGDYPEKHYMLKINSYV